MNPKVFKDYPLYDPRNEHDACGIGFIVNVDAERSHETIMKGIQILVNLTHRGASGSDPKTGDGAGITIQIPHKFFAKECEKLGFALPEEGSYGVGMLFLPVEPQPRFECEAIIERVVQEEGLMMV
jgi:glutamate synthase domain-containing protein 1